MELSFMGTKVLWYRYESSIIQWSAVTGHI